MTRKHHCGHCSLAGHYARDCHIKAEGRARPDRADELACEATHGTRSNGDTRAAVAQLIRDLFADRLARAKEAIDDVCDEGNMDRCQWIDVTVLDRELRALFDLELPS